MEYFVKTFIDNVETAKMKMAKTFISDKEVLKHIQDYTDAEAAFAKTMVRISQDYISSFTSSFKVV